MMKSALMLLQTNLVFFIAPFQTGVITVKKINNCIYAKGVCEGVKYCRNCGNKLPAAAKFCDKCGNKTDY